MPEAKLYGILGRVVHSVEWRGLVGKSYLRLCQRSIVLGKEVCVSFSLGVLLRFP